MDSIQSIGEKYYSVFTEIHNKITDEHNQNNLFDFINKALDEIYMVSSKLFFNTNVYVYYDNLYCMYDINIDLENGCEFDTIRRLFNVEFGENLIWFKIDMDKIILQFLFK
jgi:hypothetical protein